MEKTLAKIELLTQLRGNTVSMVPTRYTANRLSLIDRKLMQLHKKAAGVTAPTTRKYI